MVSHRSVLVGGACVFLILSFAGDYNCSKTSEIKNQKKTKVSCWPFRRKSKVPPIQPTKDETQEKELVLVRPLRKSEPSQKFESTQKFPEFGCEFEDKNYFVSTSSMFEPVFGKEVQPMQFDNVDNFTVLKAEIDQEYTRVMKDEIYTDLPMMLDFYDAYKAYEKKWENVSIEFLRQYVPTFRRHECVGLAVLLLERLMQRFPSMRTHVHLVTSTVEVYEGEYLLTMLEIEHLFDHNANRTAGQPPLFYFRSTHVAALLRINIKGRLGYVLMDPGLNIETPAVIMEDQKVPHQALTSAYGRNEEMTYYLPRQDYISSKESSYNYNSGRRISLKYLYYIGQPYCSFLMTTMKGNAMKPRIRVARRNEQAFPEASIAFDLSVASTTIILLANLRSPEYEHFTDWTDNRVPFNRRYEKETTRLLYEEVMKNLNYAGLENMLTKAESIHHDDRFCNYISEMNKLYAKVAKKEINDIPL